MQDLVFLPAYQLAQGIRDRIFSSIEVLEAHLAHIERYNPALNAIVTLNEKARSQAQAADEAWAKGDLWGPLHGVPVTFKDLFETQGVRTTFSYRTLAHYIPPKDAPLVARLRMAGAILLGKTNLPQGGADFQTVSPVFGRTNNPWDVSRTPGGSTGGGAAAIAAGLSPLELGNDLGGSLRIPAHFCGVYSLKPTEYRVPNSLRSNPRSLRHMISTGPMARSVQDLQLCLGLIEGADGLEWEVPPIAHQDSVGRPLSEYRFAWCDRFRDLVADTQTQTALAKLAHQLEAAGCKVEQITPQNFNFIEAWETFGELCTCQMALSQNAWVRAMGRGLSQIVPAQWIPGGPMAPGFLRGVTLSLASYMETLTRRDRLATKMDQFLQSWDGWICPVTPGPAFTHRQTGFPLRGPLEVDDQKQPYWLWGMGFTSIFNLTGNPVVTLPIAAEGLPIGVQLVGKRWQDKELLAIAQALEDLTGGFQRPPHYGSVNFC
jgi:amidase